MSLQHCPANYEVDSYIDERKDFPPSDVPLLTETGKAYYQKTDVFRRVMWYSVGDANSLDLIPISVEKVKEYIQMNKRGQKVQLEASVNESESQEESIDFSQVVGQDSLTRFDSSRRKKKKHNRGRDRNNQRQQSGQPPKNNQRNDSGSSENGGGN